MPCVSRQRQRQDAASEAALAQAAQHADDMAARLDSSQKAALTQEKVIKELQVCTDTFKPDTISL